MMVVRGGLGVVVGECLVACCLAFGLAEVVGKSFVVSCSRIFFLPMCDDAEESCLRKQAELVEEGLRNSLVVEEGGRTDFGRLVAFALALGGDERAGLGEGSCEVVRIVGEGGAGVADGDADELDASPIFAEGCEKGEVLVGMLFVFLIATEVPAEADLEEEEGAIFPVERAKVRG